MKAPCSRTLFELLEEQATTRPNGVALISDGQSFSYADLVSRARKAAGVLRTHGVKRGERVGLLVNNRAEWLEVAFGAWLLGAVVAPFSTWSTRQELEYLLGDSAVCVLVSLPSFGREDYAAMLRDLAPKFPVLGAVLMLDDFVAARDAALEVATPAPGDGASAADGWISRTKLSVASFSNSSPTSMC